MCAEGKTDDVVDVDGSYIYKKYLKLVKQLLPSNLHDHLLVVGWPSVNKITSTIPPVMSGLYLLCVMKSSVLPIVGEYYIIFYISGLVYTYLTGHVGRRTNLEGAFRALKRRYTHWASGRVDKVEVNINHPEYCHVRSTMKPSMKKGLYTVYLLLTNKKPTSVMEATCQCPAG